MQQFERVGVGDRRELAVAVAHRVQPGHRAQAAELVDLAGEPVDDGRWGHRDREHDPADPASTQDTDRRVRGRAGGGAVVGEDDRAIGTGATVRR